MVQVADKEDKMQTSEEEETEKMVRQIISFFTSIYFNLNLILICLNNSPFAIAHLQVREMELIAREKEALAERREEVAREQVLSRV